MKIWKRILWYWKKYKAERFKRQHSELHYLLINGIPYPIAISDSYPEQIFDSPIYGKIISRGRNQTVFDAKGNHIYSTLVPDEEPYAD